MQNEQPLDFQRDVLERSREIPVIVDFWAAWCGPCRVLGPVLEKLAEKHNGKWELVKINTEEHADIAKQYRIQSIPCVKLFVDGEVLDEFMGALPEYLLEEWLKKKIPSPYEKDVAAASGFMLQGEPSKARTLLEGVVHREPGNMKALSLLARLELFVDPTEALKLCAQLEHEPEHADVAVSVSTLGRLLLLDTGLLPDDAVRERYLDAIENLKEQNLDDALEKFIGVLRENRRYDDDGSRKACIAIFRLLGEEHEITMKHRRSFDRAF
ncbi:MAG: thioredoxin [Chlorobiaceae bacterium]|nr:thioredoxin [Chlorobiaceae bacterium]